jgi:hypothetical protein
MAASCRRSNTGARHCTFFCKGHSSAAASCSSLVAANLTWLSTAISQPPSTRCLRLVLLQFCGSPQLRHTVMRRHDDPEAGYLLIAPSPQQPTNTTLKNIWAISQPFHSSFLFLVRLGFENRHSHHQAYRSFHHGRRHYSAIPVLPGQSTGQGSDL